MHRCHLRLQSIQHRHHGQIAELLRRFIDRFLACAVDPARTSSVTCRLIAGKLVFVAIPVLACIEQIHEVLSGFDMIFVLHLVAAFSFSFFFLFFL